MTLLNEAVDIRLGAQQVDSIFAGGTKVWPPADDALSLFDEIMADGPIGYWRNRSGSVNGGPVTDHSGSGHPLEVFAASGAPADAASLIATEPTDPATTFIASQNFWNPPRYAAFDLTTAVTISFWMRPAAWAINGSIWRDTVKKGTNYGVELNDTGHLVGHAAPGGTVVFTSINNGIEFQAPQQVLTIGQIYHVGFVYNGAINSIDVYVNGVPDSHWRGAPDGASLLITSGNSFVCGAFSDASHSYLGDLDEIALYNKVLSPERILAHYQAGIGH